MSAAAVTVLAEAAEKTNELPFPPIAFGIIAFSALIALLAVTFAFRHVGSRH
ncbi:hypothetical protein [Rarobacter incanus]|uniref:Uncharacterized protein n=1 Tax=Rarobacter incanus TaxID=153494 RepID=A0A542SND8_9MICO|nr:hypothetical protein [Rarobacter incanus]TQK76025.1 hypothetical protein FB389_0679 [Rarobacter incanus]